MNLKLKHSLIGFFSLVLLVSTLFVTAQLKEKNDAKNLSFGLPFGFVSQDFSEKFELNETYPWDQKMELKRSSDFHFWKFIASFGAIFAGMEGAIFLLEKIKWLLVGYWNKKRTDNSAPGLPILL
jgi:hypothetical protein